MGRYVRYLVHQRVAREPTRAGLFTAAYALWDGDDLARHDRAALRGILTWFGTELTIPRGVDIPIRAVFWYRNTHRFGARMWELAQFLDNQGFHTELIARPSVGRIVYRDEHQVAALPLRNRQR